MISDQWRFHLLGQSYRLDAISQFHLQIPMKVHLGFNKFQIKKDSELRSEALKEKLSCQFQCLLGESIGDHPS